MCVCQIRWPVSENTTNLHSSSLIHSFIQFHCAIQKWIDFFCSRPKLLTESGNFVIESAKDRNVSIRLKGSSYLNINGMDVMSFLGHSNQSNVPISSLALRLSTLEGQIRQIHNRHDRNIWQRLASLEQTIMNGTTLNTSWSRFHHRVHRLEDDINQLILRLNADNCSSNPCMHGGICFNTFDSYVCRCPDTWTGNSCEQDVNECVSFANTDLGCQNSISCENTPGGYMLVTHRNFMDKRRQESISLLVLFLDAIVSPVGWEYIVQSERLIVHNHRHMKCVVMAFVCIQMIQRHTNAFVTKVGPPMAHRRLVQLT